MSWLKIDRKIQNHWIWKDPIKLKWWLDMLLTVNYADSKVLIGFDLIECKRGQSVLSLKSWGERWGVSKDTVRNFFKLLEKDTMISHESLTKTTRITICNYESYQGDIHDEQTQSKRKANAASPNIRKNNKEKKEKKEEVVGEETWRDSFDIYLSHLREEFIKAKNDLTWINEKQKYHPKLNIELTIEKSCVEFWATKKGWDHKKKSKSLELDWRSTFTNSLSQTQNKVYANNKQGSSDPGKTDEVFSDAIASGLARGLQDRD
jgi:DNA-binding transcriptional regulator YhcF (GntR family)